MELYVNDELIVSKADSELKEGWVSFFANQGHRIAFDNLQILNADLFLPPSIPAGSTADLVITHFSAGDLTSELLVTT